MINSASFLTDVFFAFFGAVTGRHFGEYPPGYPVIGGVLLIGGLLLLAVLASLLARKIKMPLPPEEREGGGDSNDKNGNDEGNGSGGDEAGLASPHAPKGNGDVPENRAPRGDTELPTGDRPDGESQHGV